MITVIATVRAAPGKGPELEADPGAGPDRLTGRTYDRIIRASTDLDWFSRSVFRRLANSRTPTG